MKHEPTTRDRLAEYLICCLLLTAAASLPAPAQDRGGESLVRANFRPIQDARGHSWDVQPNGMIGGRHNAPGASGSAFQGGYYGYVLRVLQMARGESAHPYRQLKCAGTGDLADCRAALVASLRATLAALGPDTMAWDPTLEADDAINHTALGLADPPDIHWQNRPTWQQVAQPTKKLGD